MALKKRNPFVVFLIKITKVVDKKMRVYCSKNITVYLVPPCRILVPNAVALPYVYRSKKNVQ